jgi:diaminopimelate decarboxylase
VKANGNLAIMQVMASCGLGFDVGSAGELCCVQRLMRDTGCRPRVVMTGPGKTTSTIAAGLAAGVTIVAESVSELHRIQQVAERLGISAAVGVRVNPDLDASTHPHLATAGGEGKFGMALAEVRQLAASWDAWPALRLVGLHCHVGSALYRLDELDAALGLLVTLAADLRAAGCALEWLDMGGGLAIAYGDEVVPDVGAYGELLHAHLDGTGLALHCQPGRYLVGDAGLLLAAVVEVKQAGRRRIVLCDAGMNDLLRPALYGARHRIVALEGSSGEWQPADVAGPVCESADFLGREVWLPAAVGGLVAILDAGAYGMSMASNYNGRPRPAEVLVWGGEAVMVRQRETLDDLVRGESLLPAAALACADASGPPPR